MTKGYGTGNHWSWDSAAEVKSLRDGLQQ